MVETAMKLRLAWFFAPKVVYLVLLVLLTITFAGLKDREKTFDKADTRILQGIFENVNQQPINAIYATTSGSCDFPRSELVVLGSWGGSIQGCLCGTTLHAGACTSSNCSSVSAINSTSFNTFDGFQFCVNRTFGFTNPSPSGTCLSGYKLCIASNICVFENDECPITDIQYIATSEIPVYYYPVSSTSTSSHVLMFSYQSRNAAITSLQVSLYDRPCMDPNAMPYTTNGEAYILSKVPENGCGGTGTVEHLQVIANKSASYLFLENNMNAIVWALPGFRSFLSRQEAFLVGARQYLMMNNSSSCPTINPSYLTNCKSHEDSFVNNVHGVLIAGLVFISVIFFLTIIEFVFLARRKEEDYWTRFFSTVNLLMILGLYILCITLGVIAIDTKQKMDSDVAALNDLASHKCFKQEIVNRILQDLQRSVSYFYDILWLCICQAIIACVGTVIMVLIGLIGICYGKRYGEVPSCFQSAGKWFQRKGKRTGVQGGAANPAYIEMLIANKSVVR